VPALVVLAMLVTACFLVAFAPGTFGGPLVLLAAPILLFGGLLIGRTGGTAIVTVIATGLFLVAVLTGSLRIVGDLILDTRGEEVTAVVVGTLRNPTGCAADTEFRSRITQNTVATLVSRLDGTPLPGGIGFGDRTHGNNHVYRQGEHVQVLVDPKNAVCMRAKSDVHLVVNLVVNVLAAGCVAWVFLLAARNWRARRQERYERWRATAA
jgi:hypothetical protein